MNIGQYIGAETKSIEKKIKKRLHPWSRDAAHLWRLYSSQRWTDSKVPTHHPRTKTIFENLAKTIQKHQNQTGAKVNLRIYIQAHIQYFGKEMYPNKLNSTISWFLYHAHEKSQHLLEKIDDPTEIEEIQLLSRLALTRHETMQEVLQQLKESGLFSPKFVNKYEKI